MLFSNNSEAQAIKYMTCLCLGFMEINIFYLALQTLQVAIVWLTIELFSQQPYWHKIASEQLIKLIIQSLTNEPTMHESSSNVDLNGLEP